MAAPCRYCGECLHRCVYLKLPREAAAAEMRRLDDGLPAPIVEGKCTSCAACNAFCPHGADPYDRILHRFYERYIARGLPERARYLMPTSVKSFRTDAVAALPADERALVEQWARNEPAGDVLYPGCNLITAPYLAMSGAFDELTICGSLDLCCGEMYYRFGLFDLVRRFAERLTDHYAGRPIRRMVFPCPAGFNMFSHILPEKFGARFDFPMVYFTDYLREEFDAGRLRPVRKLSGRVVMHDSCHGRLLPPLMDSVRELLERLGLTVVEARHTREDGFCCGIAAGAPRQSLADLAAAVGRAHLEYALAPAEEVMTYCTGCFLTLATVPATAGVGRPVRHVLEMVGEALGRPVGGRTGGRARRLVAGIARHAVPGYLSPRRFFVD